MFDYMESITEATHNQIDTLGERVVLDCGSIVKAIFDYPMKFNKSGSVELNLRQPTIFIKDSDYYSGLSKLEARGEVFHISRIQHDGAGAVELRVIEKAAKQANNHAFGGF